VGRSEGEGRGARRVEGDRGDGDDYGGGGGDVLVVVER